MFNIGSQELIIVMFVFLTVLLMGLWYVIAKGALEWNEPRRRAASRS